jgi:septal ring factor EnvC (AmiA/AmiB activator)
MEFCVRHLPGLNGTTVVLLPIRNEGNAVWSERLSAIGDPEHETYHAGWAFTARYAQHVSALLQEVMTTSTFQLLRLEEYDDWVQEQNRIIRDIQKGNRELLQQNHRLETCVKELNNELMRMYHSCNIKSDFLDDARTWLQHAHDELTVAQNYVHHLKVELHERDEQLMVSQA